MAVDAAYHNKCLQALYRRGAKAEVSQCDDSINEKVCHSIAFTDLVTFVQSYEDDNTTAPVFHMSSLYKLYQARLEELGVSTTVHSTRLK